MHFTFNSFTPKNVFPEPGSPIGRTTTTLCLIGLVSWIGTDYTGEIFKAKFVNKISIVLKISSSLWEDENTANLLAGILDFKLLINP